MFKIKAPNGTNNLCGKNLAVLRKKHNLSQRQLANRLQAEGYDVDHHFIRRVELGERFVTDIELSILATFFKTSVDELLHS